MGARGSMVAVALLALLWPGARGGASTVVEPIARLSLEGGYDSNPLYDGRGSRETGRISPDVGIRARDHLYDFQLTYGGDYVAFRDHGDGTWNHRGGLLFMATPTRRSEMFARLRLEYARNVLGLAAMGIYSTTRESAYFGDARVRGEYRLTRRVDLAGTFWEDLVFFDDGSGGAMHAPAVEILHRTTRHLRLGAATGVSLFQQFGEDAEENAWAYSLRGRAEWRVDRTMMFRLLAGPAFWSGRDGDEAIVPEAFVEFLRSTRNSDLRVDLRHGLGIGSESRPALVNSAGMGTEWRIGRRYVLRGDGGVWHTGRAPSGDDATLGYVVGGEAGLRFGTGWLLSLRAGRGGRLDEHIPELDRTTITLRLRWELVGR